MTKNTKQAEAFRRDIKDRAAAVMDFTVLPTTDQSGGQLTNPAIIHENIISAIQNTPMFEGVDPRASYQIASHWAMALAEYRKSHGSYPSEDLLANAHKSLETLMTESAKEVHSGTGKAMFESVGESMRTSDGVMRVAQYAALILPASMGAATSDACTFVPCTHDESDIYELFNVAGSTFGNFQIGDEMTLQSAGAYSQMSRIYPLKAKGDGEATEFNFDIKDYENMACPILSGRVRLIINRRQSKVDDGDGNLYFNDKDSKGNTFSATAKVDYSAGKVAITFTEPPAEGTDIAINAELNVERKPEIVPVINQGMRKFTVRPSQYVIASEHTVQAASDSQREFGIHLATQQFSAMRGWLSHEQDIMRLRNIVYYTVNKREFDVSLPQAQQYESWVGLLRHVVNSLSQDMADLTLATGIRGGFAGGDAANFLRSLPPQHFQIAPDYVQSPYVQYIGTLFGIYRIYEVPNPVCKAFVEQGYDFGADDIYFYGRGETLGQAGLLAGDAVPAIPYVHETNPALINRTTLWGSAINDVHPRNGENYFARLRLTKSKENAYDMLTGRLISESKGDSSDSDGDEKK